jgi:hypothetical protein
VDIAQWGRLEHLDVDELKDDIDTLVADMAWVKRCLSALLERTPVASPAN